jgi:2-polyprenyl-3-methyl-5-hydroxy-6-metoxy-1,4-benzoquinol methylase
MLNKFKDYLRKTLGIEQNRLAIDDLHNKLDFLGAYLNLTVSEIIVLNSNLLQQANKRLDDDFRAQPFNSLIHKNDLMFVFHVYNHRKDLNEAIYSYFKIGIRTATNLKAIAERFGLPTHSLLDFGSGYGRVSRFFPQVFPKSQITVSEVKEHALKFQKEQFGFNTIPHTQDADSLASGQFDIILALSVFTHLPQASFEAWLTKLIQSLQPKGGLVFTFNHIRTYNKPVTNPDFHYITLSEDSSFSFVSDSLSDTREYGSTFVSYSYLENFLKQFDVDYTFLKHEYTPHQESIIVIKQ